MLAALRFAEVVILDSDCLPLRDPSWMFSAPQYQQHGNLFWPDFWSNWVRDEAYPLAGLRRADASRVLRDGKGFLGRDAETGG